MPFKVSPHTPAFLSVRVYGVCVCRQFVEACGLALAVNERLIKEDQQEYHDEMKASYKDLARELSHIMHEQVTIHIHSGKLQSWFLISL